MSIKQLETRLVALEQAVAELQKRLASNGTLPVEPSQQPHWWLEQAGKYKGDPDFEMAMRLGRKYRDSQNPYKKKKKRKTKTQTN